MTDNETPKADDNPGADVATTGTPAEPQAAPDPAQDAPPAPEPAATEASTAPDAAPAEASSTAPTEAAATATDAAPAEAQAPEAKADEGTTAASDGEAARGAADGSVADGSAADAGAPDAGAPEGAAAESSDAPAAESAATPSEGKKKKRRRRKKKKGGEGGEGSEGGDRKTQAFSAYFDRGAAARHGFRVGDVIAGVVTRVEQGAATLDLFGRATATVDALEPRAIPESRAQETPTTGVETAVGLPAPPADDAATASPETGAGSETATATEADSETGTDSDSETGSDSESASDSETDSETETETETETDAVADPATDAAPPDVAAAPEAAAKTVAAPEPPAEEPVEWADEAPEVGSVFRGRIGAVAESGHIMVVNRNVVRPRAKGRIQQAAEARVRVEGVVYGFNRGGFDVLVEGIRAFCPASGMSLEPITDPVAFLGRKVEFSLPPSRGGKSIIVSRRGVLERELRKKARDRLKAMKVGEKLDGKVTEVRDYGALVDVGGGVEGLVHQSEIAWSRGLRPADAVKVGDAVQVEVLKVQPATRKDRFGKLSLSIKRCLPDPFDAHKDALKPGMARQGTIVRTAEFGAFVEVAPGVEGLLHISELGGKDLKHAGQVVKEGDTIHVVVERVDRGSRRISLSKLSAADVAALERGELDPTKAPRSLKPGSHIKVTIERTEHHGIFVQVAGVIGKRGRGYVPNRELPVEGPNRKKAYAIGNEIEVKVIGTDRDGQLKCSIKGIALDEERKAVREYRKEASKKGFGTFGDLLRAKIGDDAEKG